jgi:hypothetical protein
VAKVLCGAGDILRGSCTQRLGNYSLIFRLTDADRLAFLKLEGTGDFEPMPGRKMKGYVMLAEPMSLDRNELARWMERALQHTRSMPAKSKRAPKTKTGRK